MQLPLFVSSIDRIAEGHRLAVLGCPCCNTAFGAPAVRLDGDPCPRCKSPAPRSGRAAADVAEHQRRLRELGWRWGALASSSPLSAPPMGLVPP